MNFFDTSDLNDNEIYLSLIKTGEGIPKKGWVPGYSFDICLLDGTKIGF